jgi:hypothetical protein
MYDYVNKEASKVQGYSKAVTTLLVANAYNQEDLAGAQLGLIAKNCSACSAV